jgi:hypothetical protein
MIKYKEPIRFYRLARLHGVDVQALLNACRRAGITIENQLVNVFSSLRTTIEALIDRGDAGPPLAPVLKPTPPKPKSLRTAAKPPRDRLPSQWCS